MGNIFNTKEREAIIQRINRVTEADQPRWGKMNASEMICHLRDQILVALGEKKTKRKAAGFLTTRLGKGLVLGIIPWPKGKVQTSPETDQKKGGTRPSDFQKDREKLIESILGLPSFQGEFHAHPAFGKLNRKEWGRLVLKHCDHHLRQFGR